MQLHTMPWNDQVLGLYDRQKQKTCLVKSSFLDMFAYEKRRFGVVLLFLCVSLQDVKSVSVKAQYLTRRLVSEQATRKVPNKQQHSIQLHSS